MALCNSASCCNASSRVSFCFEKTCFRHQRVQMRGVGVSLGSLGVGGADLQRTCEMRKERGQMLQHRWSGTSAGLRKVTAEHPNFPPLHLSVYFQALSHFLCFISVSGSRASAAALRRTLYIRYRTSAPHIWIRCNAAAATGQVPSLRPAPS